MEYKDNMNHISKNKAGMALGAFLGFWHALWAVLVAFGLAQAFISWVFDLYFVKPPYVIGEFTWVTAVVLVIVISALGYFSGWVLVWLWDWARKKSGAV